MRVNYIRETGVLTVTFDKPKESDDIVTISSNALVLITVSSGKIIDIEIHLDPKRAKVLDHYYDG